MTDPGRRGTTTTPRTLPPPGSLRLWWALVFRVGLLGILLWVTGVCVAGRQWLLLVVAAAFVTAQAVLLRLFIRALSRSYDGLLKALRR